MSMHLVFRDLDKAHVIQHLRLQGDGNDGEEEAEKQADVEVEPPKEGGKEVIDQVVEVDEGESALLQAATYPLFGQLESMSWSRRGREIFRCCGLRTFSVS